VSARHASREQRRLDEWPEWWRPTGRPYETELIGPYRPRHVRWTDLVAVAAGTRSAEGRRSCGPLPTDHGRFLVTPSSTIPAHYKPIGGPYPHAAAAWVVP
jgi:hypothetical protein